MIQEIEPKEIFRSPTGKLLVDFGQNIVGKLRIRSLKKPEGSLVSFQHAEVLDNGELGIRPLRNAKCTDTIICSGEELEEWSPSYTFHGFRYVQVEGWTPEDEINPLQFRQIALSATSDWDGPEISRFFVPRRPICTTLQEY